MRSEDIVVGSLLADALCLGTHWVYDQKQISREIKNPAVLHDPISPYHPGKQAGDLTHYGDQVLVLLKYLSSSDGFNLPDYATAWKKYWNDPSTISYRDGATKETLKNLANGMPAEKAGAISHDLAGVSIISPLFLLKWKDDDALITACRHLTAFTHDCPDIIDAAEFFAKVILAISRGTAPVTALTETGDSLTNENLKTWLAAGVKSAASAATDSAELENHGLSCNIDGGFAGVCHLLSRYPEDPATALVANAVAGGDNSARGMVLGMIYGAAEMLPKYPVKWRNGLASYPVLMDMINLIRRAEETV